MTDTLIDDMYRLGDNIADTKAPTDVPIGERWTKAKFENKLVNPPTDASCR